MGSQEWGSVCMLRALMPVPQVRYLKIIEKSGYQALPWVRYITQNGGACDPPLGQGVLLQRPLVGVPLSPGWCSGSNLRVRAGGRPLLQGQNRQWTPPSLFLDYQLRTQ